MAQCPAHQAQTQTAQPAIARLDPAAAPSPQRTRAHLARPRAGAAAGSAPHCHGNTHRHQHITSATAPAFPIKRARARCERRQKPPAPTPHPHRPLPPPAHRSRPGHHLPGSTHVRPPAVGRAPPPALVRPWCGQTEPRAEPLISLPSSQAQPSCAPSWARYRPAILGSSCSQLRCSYCLRRQHPPRWLRPRPAPHCPW